MTIASYHQTILDYFSTQLGGSYAIAWPNVDFDKPANTAWLRPVVQTGARSNASLGTRLKRATGALVVQAFVPENTGTATLHAIETALETAFDNQTTGSVSFECVEPLTRNLSTEDGDLSTFKVNFRYDQIS